MAGRPLSPVLPSPVVWVAFPSLILLVLTSLLGMGTASACTGSCSTARQELRNISLQSIKEQILHKLGMETVPNMTGRVLPQLPPLDHLWDYGMLADQPFRPGTTFIEETDDYSSTTEKVIAFAQPHPRIRHWRGGRGEDILYFKFSDKVQESRVVGAQLWLYLRGEHEGTVSLKIFRILRTSVSPEGQPILTLVAALKETANRGGRWVSIDVRRTIADWFKYPRENLGLLVRASLASYEPSQNHRLVVTSPSQEEASYVPFLEVHTTDAKRTRTKRTIGLNCPENSEETRCCRYPLTVDFEEFGWDWIIAPKKYEANYCSGECPLVFLPNYPHTHIVQLANPVGTSGPCCAPRKMSSISMLYFDHEFNIIYGFLPGMVVDRCGCS